MILIGSLVINLSINHPSGSSARISHLYPIAPSEVRDPYRILNWVVVTGALGGGHSL